LTSPLKGLGILLTKNQKVLKLINLKLFIWYLCRCVFYVAIEGLYGAETWTLRKMDQKYLESFKMWCWRRMEKISWTDRVRYEEVLHRVKERNIVHTIKEGRLTGLVTSCVETAF
jgi:hypothetical protein